jgi:hypothetical protein
LPSAPKSEEEIPPNSRGINKGYNEPPPLIIEDIKLKNELENNSKNQKLARTLVLYTLIILGVLCVSSLVFGFFGTSGAEGVFDKTLTIIQSALFTFLGFLFGERSSKK